MALKAGTAVFKHVPDAIGKIVYCDSTNAKAAPDSKEKTRVKLLMSSVIPLLVITICWFLLSSSPVWATVITIVACIVAYICIYNSLTFSGTDYFVGTEGAAVVSFKKSRENIVRNEVFLFRDFKDIVTGETLIYRDNIYQKTEYHFTIYGHEQPGLIPVLFYRSSNYVQEDTSKHYDDRVYRFCKRVEEAWSQYKLPQLKNALGSRQPVGFNLYSQNKCIPDYLVFKDGGLYIYNKVYDRNNIKNIHSYNGDLIIEDINYSSSFLGLIQKGDRAVIPMQQIGNSQLFLACFEYFRNVILRR